MSGRTLVAGIGNIFLCDDGFGVEVARRLADADLPAGVTVTDYGIRGMHLAYDLASGFDAAILVDATARGGAPGTIYVIEPDLPSEPAEPAAGSDSNPLLDAHGMQPDVVLGMLGLLGGARPGRIVVVGCEPASVAEGMGLSEPVAAAVGEAARVVLELVTEGPKGWARRGAAAGHGTYSHGKGGTADHGAAFTEGWTHVPRHTR
jgi:hydrogenase maturation protease